MAEQRKLKKFDVTKVKRERCIKWDPTLNSGKGGALTTSDFLDEDKSVNTEACAKHGVSTTDVKFLTVADLAPPFSVSAKAALAHAAGEAEMSADDYVWKLVIADAMQDAYNASVRSVKVPSDKTVDRTKVNLITILRGQGKSETEIAAVLAAAGLR